MYIPYDNHINDTQGKPKGTLVTSRSSLTKQQLPLKLHGRRNQKVRQRRLLFLLYYAGAATVIALWLGQANWLFSYRLTTDGIGTQAQVTKTTCADNSTFSYRFSVDGQAIEGSGGDGNGNPPCQSLKPGDTVQVFYLAAEPQKNLPGNPRQRLGSETAFIAMAAFILPLLLLFILFLILRRRQP